MSDGPFLEGRGPGDGAEAPSVGACHPNDICRSHRADVVAADLPVVGAGTSERQGALWPCLPAQSLCPRGRGFDGPLRLKRLMPPDEDLKPVLAERAGRGREVATCLVGCPLSS